MSFWGVVFKSVVMLNSPKLAIKQLVSVGFSHSWGMQTVGALTSTSNSIDLAWLIAYLIYRQRSSLSKTLLSTFSSIGCIMFTCAAASFCNCSNWMTASLCRSSSPGLINGDQKNLRSLLTVGWRTIKSRGSTQSDTLKSANGVFCSNEAASRRYFFSGSALINNRC